MPEHLVAIVAGPGRQVPARVTGLLLPAEIDITSMRFDHPPHSALWSIQLTVRVPSPEGLRLFIRRLNRLIDVLSVATEDPDADVTSDTARSRDRGVGDRHDAEWIP